MYDLHSLWKIRFFKVLTTFVPSTNYLTMNIIAIHILMLGRTGYSRDVYKEISRYFFETLYKKRILEEFLWYKLVNQGFMKSKVHFFSSNTEFFCTSGILTLFCDTHWINKKEQQKKYLLCKKKGQQNKCQKKNQKKKQHKDTGCR